MMKLLLDSCVSRQAVNELTESGHDVLYAPAYWPEDPGDDEILKLAFDENRVVVTIDKDFGELTVRQGLPHSGLIRLVNLRVAQHVFKSLSRIAKNCTLDQLSPLNPVMYVFALRIQPRNKF